MYCPHPFKRIARKGTGIGVEGVRSHERNASEKADGEEGMVKISARSPELDNVAGLQLYKGYFLRIGAGAVVCSEKIV